MSADDKREQELQDVDVENERMIQMIEEEKD